MEQEDSRRRRRRNRTTSPNYSHAVVTNSHDAPTGRLTNIDDLHELILLHITSPVSILRAGATCRRWRRLISTASFLRRLSPSLRSPHVVGHYYSGAKTSFVLPMPWSPAPEPEEKTAVDYVHHRLSSHDSILPPGLRHDTYSMDLTDSSGGLLAFVRHDDSSVVVYDPLTLKCREVNLPAATTPASEQLVSPCLGAFFLDADDTRCLSMLNFRLLWVCFITESEGEGHGDDEDDDDIRRFTAKAFIFSASENRWIFMNSTMLEEEDVSPEYAAVDSCPYGFVGRMEGSIVWSVRGGKVMHLSETSGEFTTFTLPATGDPDFTHGRWNLRLVGGRDDGEDDAMRLARIVDDGEELEVLRCELGGGGDEVMVERTAKPVRTGQQYQGVAIKSGSVVVSPSEWEWHCVFTVDMETMVIEHGPKRNWRTLHRRDVLLPYELPWPAPIKRVGEMHARGKRAK